MWLWESKKPAYYVNIRAKGEAPTFECKQLEHSNGKFNGDLSSIWVREPNEYVNFSTIQLEFYDNKGDRYILSGGFNSVTTSLINALAGAVDAKSDFKNISLSLYAKDGYARIGVFGNSGMLSWKYDIKELNAMTKKVRVNGKDVTDREELDNFLREEIVKINNYLQGLDNTPALEEDSDFNPTEDIYEDVEVEVTREDREESEEVNDLPF